MELVLRLAGLVVLLALSMGHGAAASDDSEYPSRPVKLVVPFPPGGGNDVLARIVTDGLSQRLGKQFVVDNRSGANGNIGMAVVAAAPPDGYTLVLTTVGTWAVNPHLYKANFDVVKDFVPIMNVTYSPGILAVHPGLPVENVSQLIAAAKAAPKPLTYGSAGIGGFGHVSGAMFSLMTGAPMTHVPYRGAGPAQSAAIAGEVQVLFNDILSTMPLVNSGQLRAVAITTKARIAPLPNVPAIAETVPGFENISWTGFAAPAGTPPAIVRKLSVEMREVLKMPVVIERIAATNAVIVGSSPEEFASLLKDELAKYGKIVRDANITME